MNKYKLQAFTIMEVTVTMLIAAILIAITYTSYSVVLKSYNSFTVKNKDMAVLTDLDHLLKRDFEKADMIWKAPDGFSFKKDSLLIKYEFTPDFIIRRSARADTFKVQSLDVSAGFENVPATELQPEAEQNRVDELGFTLLFQNEKIPYHYSKIYSSENLINKVPDALN